MKETIAIIAAFLAIAGNVPYLREIVKGRVKPHPYTWLVGTIVSGIIVFGQIAKGAGVGVWPTIASEVFTLIIFLFSLRFGFKGITKSDTFFLVLALSGVVLWVSTKDPTLSVIIAVGIDLISLVPTFRKTWTHPKTEAPILFIANTLRHTLALLSLETYNIATMLHSIVMIGTNSALAGIILLRKQTRRTTAARLHF